MEVTQWPLRLVLLAVLMLIIVGVLLLMRRSWRTMRSGASDLYIPRSCLVEVTLGSGVAGSVRAKERVVVFVWNLGEHRLATGVRADTAGGHKKLIELLESEMSAG